MSYPWVTSLVHGMDKRAYKPTQVLDKDHNKLNLITVSIILVVVVVVAIIKVKVVEDSELEDKVDRLCRIKVVKLHLNLDGVTQIEVDVGIPLVWEGREEVGSGIKEVTILKVLLQCVI